MAVIPAPKGLGRLFVAEDTTATRRDDARDAQVRQLSAKVGPSAAPIRRNGVVFAVNAAGTGIQPVDVAHLLGKAPQGFRVVNINQPLAVSQGTALHPDKHINLTCQAPAGALPAAGTVVATADVEVW